MSRTLVTLICGSERLGGNTEQVSRYAAEYLRQKGHEAQVFCVAQLAIKPCGTCGDCNWARSPCLLEDDMAALIDEMKRSDAIVYAAPVHGFGMAHPMQIFIERAGVCFLRFQRPLENKLAEVIAIGRRYNIGHVHDQLVNNILLNRMIKPGAGYPVLLHGGRPGIVFEDAEGMSALHAMLDRLSDLITALRPVLRALKGMRSANERSAVSG